MKYQIELKVDGCLYELQSDNLSFTFDLYKQVAEDFEIDENNCRITALRAYVRVCYQLFLQRESIDDILEKIES